MPRWRRALRAAWLVAAAAAVAWALVAQREGVADHLGGLGAGAAALSGVGALVAVGLTGLLWREMLAGLGGRVGLGDGGRLYFTSQLGKYLPGGLWPLLAQAEFGGDRGLPPRHMVAAFALTTWLQLASGLAVAAVAVPASGLVAWGWALLALPCAAALVPSLLRGAVARVLRLLRREPLPPLATSAVGRGVALAGGMWLAYGAHLAPLLEGSVGERLLTGVAVFALSWSVGLLVLPAPAGAGVREAVVVLALPGLTTGAALGVALLSRAWLVVADVAWAAAPWALRAVRRAR